MDHISGSLLRIILQLLPSLLAQVEIGKGHE